MSDKAFQIKELKSKTLRVNALKSYSEIEAQLTEHQLIEGAAVFYFDHRVAWAVIHDSKLRFKEQINESDFSFIQECRLFSVEKELYLRRSEVGGLIGRFRIDNDGDVLSAVDVRQIILGHPQKTEDGFVYLSENQGSSGWVPFSEPILLNGNLAVTTRNYIGYAGLNAGYVDSRLVEIINLNNKEVE